MWHVDCYCYVGSSAGGCITVHPFVFSLRTCLYYIMPNFKKTKIDGKVAGVVSNWWSIIIVWRNRGSLHSTQPDLGTKKHSKVILKPDNTFFKSCVYKYQTDWPRTDNDDTCSNQFLSCTVAVIIIVRSLSLNVLVRFSHVLRWIIFKFLFFVI